MESKWAPKGPNVVKMWSKKGQPVSKRAQLGSKWLKMASTRHVKMAPNAAQTGPTRPKGVKMASKWPQIPQNGLFQVKFA